MEHLEELSYIGINQDHTCITLATSTGFSVFNTYPLTHFYTRGIE